MEDERFTTGHVIDATYRVESMLSDTEHAQVYAVTHLRFPEAPLILKVASHARTNDFERDTAALAVLTNRCIARVCDRGKLPDGRLFRVVERLLGPSLREALLAKESANNRPFTDERVMELLVALAAVVHEAHANALGPCDLSVNNLMFADGRDGRLCLMRALIAEDEAAPSPDVDQQALVDLRITLECGRDEGFGKTATWKAPESIEEIRAVMASTLNGPKSPPSSKPGTQIDNWTIVEKMSDTLSATVYEVTGNAKQVCVLKVAGPSADHEAFVRHARLLAQINSPHVVRILDAGTHEGAPYVVMEHLHMSESARIKNQPALSIGDALEIVDDMLDGAEEVARHGGGPCDFSLDHAYQATADSLRAVITHATTTNRIFRLYGSPVEGELADCWSAAVALYELIATRLPFPTSKHSLARAWMGVPIPLGSRRRDVPPALSLLVTRVLTNEVRLTTRELRRELRRLRATPIPDRFAVPLIAERRSIEPPPLPGVRRPTPKPRPVAAVAVKGPDRSIPPPALDWRLELSSSRSPVAPLVSAAISRDGRHMVAAGRDSIARYRNGQWTVDPARGVASTVRSFIPMGDDGGWLVLTTSGTLLRLKASGGFAPWGPSLDRICFFGAIADPIPNTFILLGGATDGKRRGVMAKLVGESLTLIAANLEVKTLLAGTYLSDGTILVCGEEGHIARLRNGVIIESCRPCDVNLLTAWTLPLASPSNGPSNGQKPVVVGGASDEILVTGKGAWAFHVTVEPLKTTVEAVDTLSALTHLSVDEMGDAWIGTNKGRILRRRDQHWRRMNRTFSGDPAVLAIHASPTRMRAVLADGHIVRGKPITDR